MSDVPLTEQDPKNTTSYRLARAAVIILGALLALAFVLLVVGLIWRMSGHSPQAAAPDGLVRFNLAPGARIISMDSEPNRLILRIRSSSGEEIDIIDTETGRLVGQVKTPPPQNSK